MAQNDRVIATDIPARLDRLPWGRFHTLVVVALGITWIFDGLEVTLAGSLAGALKESPSLRFSNTDIGLASSAYLAGAVLGALFFGWLTDRLGRKRLFFLTLTVYLVATAATAASWSIGSFAFFRFLTGAGIGGEYAAINSTIQELVPARVRGWNDLVINGSFWLGAALGALGSLVLLDPRLFDPEFGWRRGPCVPDFFHAVLDSGKPALADNAWPFRPGGKGHDRYRAPFHFAPTGAWPAAGPPACTPIDSAAAGRRRPVQAAFAAHMGRAEPHGVTGIFL
jgi:MFS family permease